MADVTIPRTWRACHDSICGASHLRAGKPNQDARLVRHYDSDQIVIAAVADGHGSRKSFRSDRGARFAVEIAVELLEDFIGVSWSASLASEYWHAVEVLPERIVFNWQRRVDEDLHRESFGESERNGLTPSEQDVISADPRKAYGTTLIAALMLPECAVYLQLGDGDVLIVGENGAEPSRPLPGDERSFANETASLGSTIAAPAIRRPGSARGPSADFRVRVVPMSTAAPALILLTTDGYANAFVSDADFRQAATDILKLARTEGWEFVERHLNEWLTEASSQGSGDDVTVVLLIRQDGVALRESASKSSEGEVQLPATENSSATDGD